MKKKLNISKIIFEGEIMNKKQVTIICPYCSNKQVDNINYLEGENISIHKITHFSNAYIDNIKVKSATGTIFEKEYSYQFFKNDIIYPLLMLI